jgi:hypothetical protein
MPEIQYQNIFGRWMHYSSMAHEATAFKIAEKRARQTGKRHRLVDDQNHVLDIIDP